MTVALAAPDVFRARSHAHRAQRLEIRHEKGASDAVLTVDRDQMPEGVDPGGIRRVRDRPPAAGVLAVRMNDPNTIASS
jgi:hypothetical protein